MDVVEVRHHDPGDGSPLPTVVVFHGYGSTPEDIVHLYDGYPGPLRVLAPRAPGARPAGGFAWYDVDGQPELFPGDRETEMRVRAEELGSWLEDLAGACPPSPPLAVGFSQGGMTAFLLAARHPELLAGAVPIGGNLPESLLPGALAPVIPVRALHGDADPRIPLSTARDTVAAFGRHGGDATLETFPGVGHAVPAEVRARLWTLTAELLGPVPASPRGP